jgi:hypothetical protein
LFLLRLTAPQKLFHLVGLAKEPALTPAVGPARATKTRRQTNEIPSAQRSARLTPPAFSRSALVAVAKASVMKRQEEPLHGGSPYVWFSLCDVWNESIGQNGVGKTNGGQ